MKDDLFSRIQLTVLISIMLASAARGNQRETEGVAATAAPARGWAPSLPGKRTIRSGSGMECGGLRADALSTRPMEVAGYSPLFYNLATPGSQVSHRQRTAPPGPANPPYFPTGTDRSRS